MIQEHMDEDLETMSREALMDEARRLRNGIRAHRDTEGHALCWYHPQLWSLLPEKTNRNVFTLALFLAVGGALLVWRYASAQCDARHIHERYQRMRLALSSGDTGLKW